MGAEEQACYGQSNSLIRGSRPYYWGNGQKVAWAMRKKGVRWVLQRLAARLRRGLLRKSHHCVERHDVRIRPVFDETLNLQPGELAEVKTEEEIRATLDADGRNHGLLWMRGMDRYCGKRCRVFRRVNTILLESTGQQRKMKNTVLLEGLTCDGSDFFGCDRSCFYYWREAWLRRVPDGDRTDRGTDR